MATKERARPDPKDFQFSKQEKATLVKLPGSINGLDFILEDLTDCKVYLLDHSSQVQIDNCTGCEILIGPVDGPAFFRDCRNCKVAVACRQLRTRDCHKVDISLHVATDPIIESSSGMRFCPWMPSYPEVESQFKAANLLPRQNKWDAVYDFTPPLAGEAAHWSVLAEAERPEWTGAIASVMSEGGAVNERGDVEPSQTEAPTDSFKGSTPVAPSDASFQPVSTGHVSVAPQPEPSSLEPGKASSDVRHGAPIGFSSEVVKSDSLEASGSDKAGSNGKDGVPAALQRAEPELPARKTAPTESSVVDPGCGQASASEGTLADEGGNRVANQSVTGTDESGSGAVRPKPGVFGLLVRTVRRMFGR